MSSSSPAFSSRILKSIGIMSIITMLSRILGLVREIVRATLLGTSWLSDAYILAFSLPNLFRRLSAEGAMLNAFVPVLAEVKQETSEQQTKLFVQQFFWLVTLILTLFSALFILAAPWLVTYVFAAGFDGETLALTVLLTRWMFIYILFISLAAILQGVLNTEGVFWVSSFTPVILNLSIISFAWFMADRLENPTWGFAIGVITGGFLQLAFQIPFFRRRGFQLSPALSWNNPYIKKVFRFMLPGLFGAGIYQFNIVISNIIATGLQEGSLSSLNFSNRLLELVLGVVIVSITTALLPSLSRMIAEANMEAALHQLIQGLRLVSFLAFPVIAGMLATRNELISLLFKRGQFDQNSVLMTSQALVAHIPGLLFIGWNRVLTAGFHASRDFKTPVRLSFITMLVNLSLALYLSQYFQHQGIAAASTVSQIVQCFLLLFFVKSVFDTITLDQSLIWGLVKHLLASVAMYLLLKIAMPYIDALGLGQILSYALYIIWAVFIFGSISLLLKVKEIQDIVRVFKKQAPKE